MSKLFCCGITSNQENNIKDLVLHTKDYVDGFVWTVHDDSIDGTYEILNENKKEGKIVRTPYLKAHDWSANAYLHCGTIKNEDWVIINDSKERLTSSWLMRIRHDIEIYKQKEIGAVYCSGRPFLFQFWDHQIFEHTPHWWLNYPVGKITQIPETDKDRFIINKRKDSPAEHFCLHDILYWYTFGRSNQVQAFYGEFGHEIVNYHENLRFHFRHSCRKLLELEFTLDSLENYLRHTRDYPEWLIQAFEIEFCLSEFFRLKILREDFMKDIVPMRERWSFRNFLLTGDGFSDKNYLGTRLKYRASQNKNT
jgi:hypothetical protein